MVRVLLAAQFIFYLSLIVACSPLYTQDSQSAACRELKSQLIFNGATSNDRQAEIERSQRALIQRSYNLHCT